MKQKEQADIDALAKDYATVNYARAAKQSEDDAEYIQAVSFYSFKAGYQSKHDELEKTIVELHAAFTEQFDLAQKFMKLDFEHQSKQVAGEWVKASERLPEKAGRGNRVIVKYGQNVYYGFKNHDEITPRMYIEKDRMSFITLDCLWLDESQPPKQVAQAGNEAVDGWISEKPKTFTEDCVLLTASWFKDHWETVAYEMRWIEGFDENEHPAYYWSISQDDQEWGDYADLYAELYKIIPLPKPPLFKEKK